MTHLPPTQLSPDAERVYATLDAGTVAFVRDGTRHLEFIGAKAADVLNGLITNDVGRLGVGEGQYAAALTAKGRVVADMRILRLGDERYLTSTNAAAWAGWEGLVRKYVNPRLARYTPRSWRTVALHGATAVASSHALLAALGATHPDGDLPAPYACRLIAAGDEELLLVHSPALAPRHDGVELLVPEALSATLTDWLATPREALSVGDESVWEVARVEAARPEWGVDMDETTIPQEANLEQLNAISFEKGCYTGQETVARIHFRGHVNRHLRLLGAPTPLPSAAELRTAEGKVVGDVRSSVVSPKRGPVAIAMVRRELAPGDSVSVHWTDPADGERSVAASILQ